jgi:hypothetical protein
MLAIYKVLLFTKVILNPALSCCLLLSFADVDRTLIHSIGKDANKLHKERFTAGFKEVFGLERCLQESAVHTTPPHPSAVLLFSFAVCRRRWHADSLNRRGHQQTAQGVLRSRVQGGLWPGTMLARFCCSQQSTRNKRCPSAFCFLLQTSMAR